MVQAYLAQFISIFTQLLIFAIFARVILSWLRVPPRGFLVMAIIETTEPVLGFFRRVIPPLGGIVDLSPLFAFLALDLLRSILLRLLA
ncbi:YggT family protein [Candidatus Peregrinibacteria bacterium]|nr:YggT family protein [Candidatus Peregrinibacteria bacterium]